MKQYIKNLLPRLQQYSRNLDHIENFVDKPWMVEDEMGNRRTFIFQRDHSLIESYNGLATMGKWRYVSATQGLLINVNGTNLLLNQALVADGLMIMKLDGNMDRPWLLVNQQVVPDLDASRYLREFTIQKLHLKQITVGYSIYYYSDPLDLGIDRSTIFFDTALNQVGVNLIVSKNGLKYQVENGVVVKNYHEIPLRSDKGTLHVHASTDVLGVGDPVFLSGEPARDGIYPLIGESFSRLVIRNGKISDLQAKPNYVLVVIVLLILVILAVLFFVRNRNNSGTLEPPNYHDSTVADDHYSKTATVPKHML